MKQRKGWRLSCDVREVTENYENAHYIKLIKELFVNCKKMPGNLGYIMGGSPGDVSEEPVT